jgi:hypothetical protein
MVGDNLRSPVRDTHETLSMIKRGLVRDTPQGIVRDSYEDLSMTAGANGALSVIAEHLVRNARMMGVY